MSHQVAVELIDFMGSDKSVVNAARVSFAKDTSLHLGGLDERDQKLIQYLAKHKHWTPFAHTAATFKVTAPVSIRTQCFKHKVGLVENEISRRYVSTTPEVFTPDRWRGRPDKSIKQGSGKDIPMQTEAHWEYQQAIGAALMAYDRLLDMGVAPEQARFVLPQGMLTSWYWTGSLPAYARFYNERTHGNAQAEIKRLAEVLGGLVELLFPASWRALTT